MDPLLTISSLFNFQSYWNERREYDSIDLPICTVQVTLWQFDEAKTNTQTAKLANWTAISTIQLYMFHSERFENMQSSESYRWSSIRIMITRRLATSDTWGDGDHFKLLWNILWIVFLRCDKKMLENMIAYLRVLVRKPIIRNSYEFNV